MDKALLTNIAVGAGGVAVGGFLGFLVTKKALAKKYRELAETEIESVREAYHEELKKLKIVPENQKFATPEEAAEALRNKPDVLTEEEAQLYNDQRIRDGQRLVETLTENEYVEVADPPKKSFNIWDQPGVNDEPTVETDGEEDEGENDWPGNPENEFTTIDGPEIVRSADVPYVLPIEEYYAEADGYTKLSVGYFEGDNVLADERDRIIDNLDDVVGQKNMDQFGFLSQDKNTVYIRNERLRTDFEVSREEGSYTDIILRKTVPAERKPKPRKMRENE